MKPKRPTRIAIWAGMTVVGGVLICMAAAEGSLLRVYSYSFQDAIFMAVMVMWIIDDVKATPPEPQPASPTALEQA